VDPSVHALAATVCAVNVADVVAALALFETINNAIKDVSAVVVCAVINFLFCFIFKIPFFYFNS
jgi:hypothetical protein